MMEIALKIGRKKCDKLIVIALNCTKNNSGSNKIYGVFAALNSEFTTIVV